MKRVLPWVLLAGVLAWAILSGRDAGRSAEIAEAAEARADSLAVVSDSLRAVAEARDTVLVAVTDTVRVIVERERIVQIASVDTIRAHVDSVGSVALDSLLASEAREDVAQDRLQAETLAWGGSWKALAEVNQAGWTQERIRGDLWEAAARSQRRRAWYERGAALLAIGVLVLR